MTEFTAPSGARILINPADWKYAKELKKAIEKELKLEGNIDLNDPALWIKNILHLDGSDAFDAALWPCLRNCSRDNEKITQETFNSTDARKDYYDIIQTCLKENLGPLVESLFLRWSEYLAKQAKAPKDVQEPLSEMISTS